MRVHRWALFVIMSVVLSTAVLVGPAQPAADAQATCQVSNEAELGACITAYATAAPSSTTTIELVDDITLTAALPAFANTQLPTATAVLDGAGYTLNAGGATTAIQQTSGDLQLIRITVRGADQYGLSTTGGTTLVESSTFTANEFGVQATSTAALTVRNSSLVDNISDGIEVAASSSAIIEQSTIAENGTFGIAVLTGATAAISGSLIAENGTDCFLVDGLGALSDQGGNIIADATCTGTATPEITGTYSTTLAANECTIATPSCPHTLALQSGSPAIDINSTCSGTIGGKINTDQRGVTRTAGSCDAGAFELGNCVSSFAASNESQLAFAIGCYNIAASSTTTTITLSRDIQLTELVSTINNTSDPAAKLKLIGNGRTLDAGQVVGDALHQAAGSVTLSNITVAGSPGAGLRILDGVTVIENSTFTQNSIGAITQSTFPIQITNSTFYANTDEGLNVDWAFISSTTIVNNGGFGLRATGVSGLTNVAGSLIASHSAADCGGTSTISDGGGNIFSDATCSGTATPDVIDTYAAKLADNNCGSAPVCTQTLALFPTSPAVDANLGCSFGADQRGVPRLQGSCDAGAFEVSDCSASTLVGSADELAFAIHCYNAAPTGSTNIVTLTADIPLSTNLPAINNMSLAAPELTFDGSGYTLDGGDNVALVLRQIAGNLLLRNVTITGATSRGIQVDSGATTIQGSTFTGNFRGIFAGSKSPMQISNSTIVTNSSHGISVGVGDSIVLVQTTIAKNGGHGIAASSASATLQGSLVAGNALAECSDQAAVTDDGGNIVEDDSCTTIATATIADTYDAAPADNECVITTPSCAQTIALLAGSPAIDADPSCEAGIDQRGVTRTAGSCDAGSFELGDVDVDGDTFDGPLGDNADCDDTRAEVNPDANEIPYNGLDDNCDGTNLNDVDGDGSPADMATGGTPDCDDTNPDIHPGATEIPYNGLDDNCDGTNLNDVDGDGSPADMATGGTPDCDDTNPDIHPGATDFADDGVDQDCDGQDGAAASDTCNGLAVTIDMNTNGGVGTGSDGDDVILGTPDADTISGGLGNDTICGGEGDDTISGDDGDDTILGEAGDDQVFGGLGADKLFGAQGHDVMFGGDGDDVLHGNRGDDELHGEAGNDRIFGYAHNDVLTGGEGDDRLHGNFGDDTIDGDDGDDRIFGYGDNDTLNGGAGNDLITGNFGDDVINGNQDDDILYGADGDDTVNGGQGNDEVNGNSLNDILSGGPGDDTLDGGINNDECNGGPGNDTGTRCETLIDIP